MGEDCAWNTSSKYCMGVCKMRSGRRVPGGSVEWFRIWGELGGEDGEGINVRGLVCRRGGWPGTPCATSQKWAQPRIKNRGHKLTLLPAPLASNWSGEPLAYLRFPYFLPGLPTVLL